MAHIILCDMLYFCSNRLCFSFLDRDGISFFYAQEGAYFFRKDHTAVKKPIFLPGHPVLKPDISRKFFRIFRNKQRSRLAVPVKLHIHRDIVNFGAVPYCMLFLYPRCNFLLLFYRQIIFQGNRCIIGHNILILIF